MGSLNKVQLIGNLGRDPEVRYMPNGTPTATISVATSERWKDKATGEARESVEWHRVVFFRGLAEVVGKYLKQGSAIYVEGKLKTRKWQDKEGQDRYTTEIQAAELIMLGGKADAGSGAGDGVRHRDESQPEDDIPF